MKVVLIISLCVATFVLSVVGMYFAMPYIAPDRVKAVQADSTALAATSQASPLQDALDAVWPDSVRVAPDSLAGPGLDLAWVAALQDSLRRANDSLAVAAAEIRLLQLQLKARDSQLAGQSAPQAEITELSETLVKLDEDALAPIIQQLSLPVLRTLYAGSSPRNRAKLLQAMSADQAAQFVNTVARVASDRMP